MSAGPRVSFEFFPPKTEAMETSLWRTITRLAPLDPCFVSVTYGAGGSTRERTHAIVARIRRDTDLAPAAHLTCVGASRDEIDTVARGYWNAGIRHLVALRGDPPAGAGAYQPHPEGYARAVDLVAGLKRIADFEISVAAYPEVHPEAVSAAADLDNLKRKTDAGASRAITQFFFDPASFLRFRDRAAPGISVPIVPGILPIGDFAQAKKFALACGAAVPAWLEVKFAEAGDDAQARAAVSERVAVAQCRRLIDAGVEALHFYTLNRAALVAAICAALDIGVAAPADAVIAE